MWVTIILILVVAFFTVLIYRLIAQRREKKVSVTVMAFVTKFPVKNEEFKTIVSLFILKAFPFASPI